MTEIPGDAFDRLLDDTAGRHATAVTLASDRNSSLAASGHVPAFAGLLRPASRGDRVRRAVLADIIGEDGLKALPGSS